MGKTEMCFSRIRQFISRNSRRIRIILAIMVFLIYLVVVVLFAPIIVGDYFEITREPKPRNFELPIYINLNGTRGFDVDISFSLNFTYQKGTLVVDEPIEINSIAVFLSKNAENVETVQLGIQNGLAYNTTTSSVITDYYGIPVVAYLFFNSSQSGIMYPYVWTEKITAIWMIDGIYHPILAFTFKDGTEPLIMLIEDVAITVYPREQLTQIQSNKVTIELTLAVFIFSFFGVFSIIMDLLREETKPINEKLQKAIKNFLESQQQPQTEKQKPPKKEKE